MAIALSVSCCKVHKVVIYISAWASALLVQTTMGNARALISGTSDRYRFPRTDSRAFLFICLIFNSIITSPDWGVCKDTTLMCYETKTQHSCRKVLASSAKCMPLIPHLLFCSICMFRVWSKGKTRRCPLQEEWYVGCRQHVQGKVCGRFKN